jgi:peptidoglycan biosynthesis protein MviN/MurJ (putative lipid II flippase)
VPALIMAGEAVLNLTLSIVLATTMGLAGVALGSLVAVIVANVGCFYPYMCRQFGIPIGALSATLARAHLPALLAAGLVGGALASLEPSGALVPACAGAICAAYLAVFWFSGLQRGERREVVSIARRLRSRGEAR